MKLDRYEFKSGQNFSTFEFLSEGKRGKIVKIIQFSPMNYEGLYNLAFGDKNSLTGELNDGAITDNGDSEKVLATVVASIYTFSEKYKGSWIYATGSTKTRTRLYRMGINKYFEMALTDFEIMGEWQGEWEVYVKGTDYNAFAVSRKY